MNRTAFYVVVNALAAVAILVGFALHKDVAHPLYVILLFAICSTPIIEAKTVNGPYSLLVLWSFDYFLMYGALDLRNLLFGVEGIPIGADGMLSEAELVILLGGVLVQIAYRVACSRASKSRPTAPPKNWSEPVLVVVGILMWIISSRLAWVFSVDTFTANTTAAVAAGFASLGGVKTGMFMIARMAQPLSILILAYAQCRYKRAYMTPIVLVVVFYQLVFGFIIDTKSEGLIGAVLVILTNFLVNGRIPKVWLAVTLVVIVVGFPILQANREIRDERNINPMKAAANLALLFQKAIEATGRTNKGGERAQTALERATTKGSVETIVKGTGTVTPFEYGYTLTPMFEAFIPRLLWADKPSIPTGQIMNKKFHVTEGDLTYISPSHLGELYWNFGWLGVIVGMSLIGFLFGTLGTRFNLAEAATITRLLVIMVTAREVILASEGEFATHYVVWMRSLLGIALLHWAFARVPWSTSALNQATARAISPVDIVETPPSPLFPNLLR
jgi:O-antigen polysaccharide polymerase Wzy